MTKPTKHWYAAVSIMLLTSFLLIGTFTRFQLSHEEENLAVARSEQETASLLFLTRDLTNLAILTNEPGNDVFTSRDPKRQRKTLLSSSQSIEKAFQTLKAKFSSGALSFLTAQEQTMARLEEQIRAHQNLAFSVLSLYEKHRIQEALTSMAAMDRAHAKVLTEIDSLRKATLDTQYQLFTSHQMDIQRSSRSTVVFSLLLSLLVIAYSVLSWGASKRLALARSKEAASRSTLKKAQDELEHFISITQDLIVVVDAHGQIVRANQSFQDALGLPSTPTPQIPFLNFIVREDRGLVEKGLMDLASGKTTTEMEVRMHTPADTTLFINWSASAAHHSGLFYLSGRDITNSKQKELELQQILTAIEESALVSTTNADGAITHVNQNFCRISEYTPQELIGQTHRLVRSDAHPPEFFEEMWSTITQGHIWSGVIQNRAKSGTLYHVKTYVFPLRDLKGSIQQYLSIRFDLTKQVVIGQQLEEAQQVAKIGSWRFDLQTQRIEWSKQMFQLFPVKDSTTPPSYKDHLDSIHPEDRTHWKETVESCIQDGKPYKMRFRSVFKDHILWIEALGRGEKNAKGELVALYGTCQDITERIQTEEENRFILEATRMGVWKYIPKTQELFWDRSMYDLFEISPASFSGHYSAWENSLSPEAKAKAVKELEDALTGKKEFDTTFEIKTAAGRSKYIGGRGRVLRNPDGTPLAMFGINFDKTAEVEMHHTLELERSKAIHTAKLASLGEMSAGVAHEINNPLTIIKGNLELLERLVEDKAKFRAKITTIQVAIDRIQKIVKGLRKFSRTSDGSPHQEELLSSILEECVVLTEPKAKQNGVTVEIHSSWRGPILCDIVELEQVFVNLISNAIDAVKSKSDRWIRIDSRRAEDAIEVLITDSGSGIPPEIEAKLFQPFFTTKPVGEGTGLGLSICRGILQQHAATIEIDRSSPNTCFKIRFYEREVLEKSA